MTPPIDFRARLLGVVFEISPTKAFGFPADGETTTPTRWRFEP